MCPFAKGELVAQEGGIISRETMFSTELLFFFEPYKKIFKCDPVKKNKFNNPITRP
jgi:hypothetical protein